MSYFLVSLLLLYPLVDVDEHGKITNMDTFQDIVDIVIRNLID